MYNININKKLHIAFWIDPKMITKKKFTYIHIWLIVI